MGRIDAKLGKWFKQVEQVEKELQQKKKISVTQNQNSNVGPVNVVIEKKPSVVDESVEITTDSSEIIVNADYIKSNHSDNEVSHEEISNVSISTKVLDDKKDIPEIEDFMSYLDKVSSQERKDNLEYVKTEYRADAKPSCSIDKYMAQRDEQLRLQAAALKEKTKEIYKSDDQEKENENSKASAKQNKESVDNNALDAINSQEDLNVMGVGETTFLDNLSEGTGDPRPITKSREESKVKTAKNANHDINAIQTKLPESQTKKDSEWTGVSKSVKPEPRAETVSYREESDIVHNQGKSCISESGWENVPAHLKILFSDTKHEVAQNSYKKFRESRGELIERLLDPPITLEDAARILNVCPTTVRRYTNKGVLKHYRTAGNQRRFKLSDVLAFMESQGKIGKGDK